MEKGTLVEPTYVRATLVEAFDRFENGELSLKELRAVNRQMRQALRAQQRDGKPSDGVSSFQKFLNKARQGWLRFSNLDLLRRS